MPLSNVARLRLFLLILILLTIGQEFFFRPGIVHPDGYYHRDENAVWLGVEWVNDPHTVKEIEALADELQAQRIRYVFVFTSYVKQNGEFNTTYAHSATFVRVLKTTYPDVVVLAWLGLPLKNSDGFNAGYFDLGDASSRLEVASFCAQIINYAGYDGIHLDPEPVMSDDTSILTLLEQIREALGEDAILSIATRRIMPVFVNAQIPLIGHLAWCANYYREIANRVDQIAVMTYDSGMPTAWLYRQFVRLQVIQLSRTVDGTGVQLFIGVPTSEERTKTHNPRAEDITSGLQGVIDGLNDSGTRPEVVSGVAIYPYWEMDETEWKTYGTLWLGNQ